LAIKLLLCGATPGRGKFDRRNWNMAPKKSPKKLQRGTATKQQPLTRLPLGR
jgi:hypothetical protein